MDLLYPLDQLIPLPYRIGFAAIFFLALGLHDFRKNPGNPKRAKEYCFLFSVMGLAIAYAIAHDFVTAGISREYFTQGKGLVEQDFAWNLSWLAVKASYSIGLVLGMLLLVLNNPSKKFVQLPYRALYLILLWPLGFSLVFAATFGLVAQWTFLGKLLYLYDMHELVELRRSYTSILVELGLRKLSEALHLRPPTPATPLIRPAYEFAVVHATHWGTCFGAALGTIVAVFRLSMARKKATLC